MPSLCTAVGKVVKNSTGDEGADCVKLDDDDDDDEVDVVDREPIFVTVDDDDNNEVTAEWNERVVDDVDPEIIANEW